jgi:hypothetical protein
MVIIVIIGHECMWGTVGRSLGRSRREAKDTEW